MTVMVERDVQVAFTIQHHTNAVMRIFHISFILCPVQCPTIRFQFPFTQYQISICIVITNVLRVTFRHQRIVTKYSSIDRRTAISFTYLY